MYSSSQNLTIVTKLSYFSYLVPEYSFLDARGLGAYEGKKLESVSEVGFIHSNFCLNTNESFLVNFHVI